MQGSIVRWNDDRGFGFISSKEVDGDVFAHISQFKKGFRRPKVGDRVLFQLTNEKGKLSAKTISLIGVQPNPIDKPSLSSSLIGCLLLITLGAIIYLFLIKPKLFPAYENMGFSCQGKTYCSEMISCDEAKFYLANCPNVEIDGDDDGEPCEKQHCNSRW